MSLAHVQLKMIEFAYDFPKGVNLMKCIGVLTSGGDTPGMNAAIRAVFKEGESRGINVMGIYHGYKGLIAGMVRQLTHEDVANVMHKGGTVLHHRWSHIMCDHR